MSRQSSLHLDNCCCCLLLRPRLFISGASASRAFRALRLPAAHGPPRRFSPVGKPDMRERFLTRRDRLWHFLRQTRQRDRTNSWMLRQRTDHLPNPSGRSRIGILHSAGSECCFVEISWVTHHCLGGTKQLALLASTHSVAVRRGRIGEVCANVKRA